MNDPPPSEVVSIDGATGDNDIRRVTTVESSSAEGKEEIATETTEEAGISALVGSSEQETAHGPVKETENLHPSGTSGHLICDMASDSMHDIETPGTAKIGESQRAIDEKVTQDCTEEISMPPVLCESSEKQGDGVTISVIKDDKEPLQESHDNSSSKELGNQKSLPFHLKIVFEIMYFVARFICYFLTLEKAYIINGGNYSNFSCFVANDLIITCVCTRYQTSFCLIIPYNLKEH
jgi:hypothetical protein